METSGLCGNRFVATDAAVLILPYELRIGGKVADIRFGGVVGNTIGLY